MKFSVTFTEEILNEKLNFFCAVKYLIDMFWTFSEEFVVENFGK